jgi:hypothetical protein
MLNDVMQDAFLCFVDICVIVDHYSLFLFILYHMIYVTGIRWRLYLYAACKDSTKSWFTVDNGGSNTGRLTGKAIYEGRVKPKTIQLVFVASQLSIQL